MAKIKGLRVKRVGSSPISRIKKVSKIAVLRERVT